jgi:diguanylate cyclase (GGDEF)-like protein
MIKIFIAQGPEKGRSFLIKSDVAQIGRGSANELALDEDSVSRKHARITKKNDQYFIEDLHSSNGTWISGHAIKSGEKVPVQEGVPIAVGNVLVSLGKECHPDGLPTRYSVGIEPPSEAGRKKASVIDRRAKQKKELELIYDICIGLMGSLDLSEICEKVLDSIFGLLKRIDSGFVFVLEPESGKLKKMASRSRNGTGGEAPKHSRTVVRRVIKEGRAVMMPDTEKEDKANLSDSMEEIGVKSVICVPLVSHLGTKGALYLQSLNVPHGFRKNDLFFLTGLSTPMSLAIENAILYSKSKRAEEKLGKARENLELAVRNRTAELERAKNKLEKLSITDGLSGLYNHRHLVLSLDSEFKRAARYGHSLALLLMDIDYFKNLNDTYGHLCGDYVLKTVARILKANVRATDLVARYGGDELAVMLIETNTRSALEVAEKLKQAIASHAFKWQTQELSVKVSIGLATAPKPGIQEPSDLVNAADRALYQAKKAGRNAVVAYGQEKGEAEAVRKEVKPSVA